MMTVNEVSKLTRVSIRTLQYYDTIGLLKPIEYTESGYRLYDDTFLGKADNKFYCLKELEFPLKEIKKIIDAPNFDRNKALEQQIEIAYDEKEHLENLTADEKLKWKKSINVIIAKCISAGKIAGFDRNIKQLRVLYERIERFWNTNELCNRYDNFIDVYSGTIIKKKRLLLHLITKIVNRRG